MQGPQSHSPTKERENKSERQACDENGKFQPRPLNYDLMTQNEIRQNAKKQKAGHIYKDRLCAKCPADIFSEAADGEAQTILNARNPELHQCQRQNESDGEISKTHYQR